MFSSFYFIEMFWIAVWVFQSRYWHENPFSQGFLVYVSGEMVSQCLYSWFIEMCGSQSKCSNLHLKNANPFPQGLISLFSVASIHINLLIQMYIPYILQWVNWLPTHQYNNGSCSNFKMLGFLLFLPGFWFKAPCHRTKWPQRPKHQWKQSPCHKGNWASPCQKGHLPWRQLKKPQGNTHSLKKGAGKAQTRSQPQRSYG